MNGFDKLKEQVKDQEDVALQEVVKYLLSRDDMEQKYLKDEKTLEGMCSFIKSKGQAHAKNGWNFITNEVVFAWAVMYFSLPNSYLKINDTKPKSKTTNKSASKETPEKNNVVSLEKAKKAMEEKKQIEQLTLFGGVAQ